MPPTELSWAEARKAEAEKLAEWLTVHRELAKLEVELVNGQAKQSHLDVVRGLIDETALVAKSARHASDVALVRRVLANVAHRARRESPALLTPREIENIDPESVLAEIEREAQ